MYNGSNVQPQTHNTGRGGSDTGEPTTPVPLLSPNELPAPKPGGLNDAIPSSEPTPVKQPVPDAASSASSSEHWVNEVEQLFNRTVQTPRQRADELAELRRRYQQEVLGITQKGPEG